MSNSFDAQYIDYKKECEYDKKKIVFYCLHTLRSICIRAVLADVF